MLKIDLSGKKALVTGGSRGIGAGIVRVLSQCGAQVAFTHTGSPQSWKLAQALIREVEAQGGRALSFAASVTDEAAMKEVARQTAEALGGLDILVSNAGITSIYAVEELPVEEWRRIIDVNLNGTFISVSAALPYLLKEPEACIVLIGSSTVFTGTGGGAHYAASKAALEGLRLALLKELARRGIRTNMVHPSLIDTDLLRSRHPDPEVRAQRAQEVPVKRLGQPEDIGNLVAFLCSDLASYICGQSILVDGGRIFGR